MSEVQQAWSFVLNVDVLRRSGILNTKIPLKFIFFEINGLRIQSCWMRDPNVIRIEWRSQGQLRGFNVAIRQVAAHFGTKTLLVCPKTRYACAELVMKDNVLASYSYHYQRAEPHNRDRLKVHRIVRRLLGDEGRGAVRGKRREKLLRDLKAIPNARDHSVDVKPLLDAEIARRRREKRRPTRSNQRATPNSTRVALGVAPPRSAHPLMPANMEVVLAKGAGVTAPVLPAGRAIAALEDHAVLDMRELSEHWQLMPNERKVAQLTFPAEVSGGVLTFAVAIDIRTVMLPRLLVRSDFGRGKPMRDQIIYLSPSHPDVPRRWFLICPVTGQRGDMLYLRDGWFASRQAQRLRHRSQIQRAKPKG